ncbi:protein-tyrosine phosphatase-like protein, partial [Leucosporidium creatinivorum]
DDPRTSVADVPPFIVSSIIPGFLYLGPEPTKPEDLNELEGLGVKEVLNLALECEDKDGEVARRFELRKIGMRDFVEETGVQKAIEEACRILGDAQLQSKPVYVHCRAGKSRSVTIVLAYLVHRNHWSLKRAYSHVSERRKGISPNIGFVAELMTWEERERGRKSQGV